MIWIYRLLFLPVLLVAGPFYLRRMRKRGGYGRDLSHRFGFLPKKKKAGGAARVWIQAVSVGEIRAVTPLLDAWRGRNDVEVVLTTTTSTGYAIIAGGYEGRATVTGCFPLDFWPCSHLAWERLRPDVVMTMESELWPEHLEQARRRGVPFVLINARMSRRSFARYRKSPFLVSYMLKRLACIFAGAEDEASRFRELAERAGASTPIEASGNLKFDVSVSPVLDQNERNELRAELGFAPEHPEGRPPLILLGSATWPGEEAYLLATLRHLLNEGLPARLLIVPRHAERREELRKMFAAQDLPFHFRSDEIQAPGKTMLYVGDTTGELVRLTQAADLAFIGKSLPPHHEGQTPIEAAALGVPCVFGPEMTNFREVAASLVRSGAALPVQNFDSLKAQSLALLRDESRRRQMSRAGKKWHANNRGTAERLEKGLERFLNRNPRGAPPEPYYPADSERE
jgi:3-deoxy-D-manno-octulosonic-acid transferase